MDLPLCPRPFPQCPYKRGGVIHRIGDFNVQARDASRSVRLEPAPNVILVSDEERRPQVVSRNEGFGFRPLAGQIQLLNPTACSSYPYLTNRSL